MASIKNQPRRLLFAIGIPVLIVILILGTFWLRKPNEVRSEEEVQSFVGSQQTSSDGTYILSVIRDDIGLAAKATFQILDAGSSTILFRTGDHYNIRYLVDIYFDGDSNTVVVESEEEGIYYYIYEGETWLPRSR